MGKSTPSTPQAPDPAYVSQQQTKSNVATAVANSALNNVNQITPQGTLTYTQGTPYFDSNTGQNIPTWTAETKLSPEQQRLYDTQTRVTQGAYDLADKYTSRIGEATAQPFNYDGLPSAPVYNDQYRTQQRDAILQRNQPQMDRDRAALEQRLADQGVGIEDPAYRTAMDQYSRSVNDFRLGADTQAGSAAAQQFQLEAAARDRAIAERSNLRSQPINEVSALLGTGSVQGPSFVPTNNYQIAPTDVSGNYWNAYQGQVAQQQIAQQANNATTGGLFGLGGTALAAGAKYGLPLLMAGSDIRMKENIRRVGYTDDGQPLYFFTYKNDPATPHVGLMAQDVEKIRPDAVVEIDGMKYVDYGKALS